MIDVRQYVDLVGRDPFGLWLARLDVQTRTRIDRGLERLRMGNTADTKGVGGGVSELRFHFGPGYRVYFGRDGETLILLLAGGTKQRQERDIAEAQNRWREYRKAKRERADYRQL